MNKLEKLLAKLAELRAQMTAIIEKDEMSEEESAKFDELEKEALKVTADIDRVKRFEASQAEDIAGEGRKVAAKVVVTDNKQEDPRRGFDNIADLALAVKGNLSPGGSNDQRLNILGAPTGYLKEGGSNEGYEVPPEFKNEIFELVFNEPDLLSMVDSEPTNSNQVQIVSDESTPWGSTGVQANWVGEGSQLTASSVSTGLIDVKLHKLHAYVLATEELLEDSPRLANRLTMGASRAINWKANESIYYGTGSGQPQGFFNHGSLVNVAKESGQTAATITAANVAKMYSRSTNPGRSVWVMNQDTLPQLLTMTLGDNTAWTPPATGVTGAPGGFLFGRPILFSDQCKTLGAKGDIFFIDPMGYYSPRKASGTKFASSIHLFFDYDIQAFKWTFRIGGQPYLSTAVSPNNGSSTRSAFVSLAVRA